MKTVVIFLIIAAVMIPAWTLAIWVERSEARRRGRKRPKRYEGAGDGLGSDVTRFD